MKKLVCLLLACACLFCACESAPPAETSSQGIEQVGEKVNLLTAGYVIVYPKEGDDLAQNMAIDLQDKINRITGTSLKLVPDTRDAQPLEILVGRVNRPEAETFSSRTVGEYGVSHKDGKLVIWGADEKGLTLAYKAFTTTFLNCERITPNEQLPSMSAVEVPVNIDHQQKYQTREEAMMKKQLIAYPELPLNQDHDYTVKITQGDASITLPVYNASLASNYFQNMRDGDIHRRYAEFAFSGEPVTVEVTVHLDMTAVSVLPSSQQIPFTVSGNTVTYTLTEPQTTLIKLNDNRDTLLTIFAETPEYEDDIPNKNSPNVLYFGPGLHEPEGGLITPTSGQTVYLAPGAVVKARLSLKNVDNVTICGRGAFLEYEPNRTPSCGSRYMCQMVTANNITMRGVRFLEAHDFNITCVNVKGLEVDGIKVLSNQISTDGFSLWGTNDNIHVQNSFWHVSDDVFVIGSGNKNEVLIENCIVGSDYGVFCPSGFTGELLTFRNIDVFRAGHLLRYMSGTDTSAETTVTFENIHAQDVDGYQGFANVMGPNTVARNYVLKNLSLPAYGGALFQFADSVKNVTFTVDNVWVGDKAFTKADASNLKENTLTFTSNSDQAAAKVGVNLQKTDPYIAEKVYINNHEVETEGIPYVDGDTVYTPIVELLEDFGFAPVYKDGTLTFGDHTLKPVEKDGMLYVPLSALTETLGGKAIYDAASKRVTVDNLPQQGNLLRNPGFEEKLTADWVTRWFTPMYLSEDAHSGKYAIRTRVDSKSYVPGPSNGIYQDVAEVIRKYGTGTYKLSAWVKKTAESDSTLIQMGYTEGYDPVGLRAKLVPTTDWQYMEHTFTVSGKADPSVAYFYIGYADGEVKEFIIDDLSMEKIS